MTAQQAAQQVRPALHQDLPTVTYNWPADPDALGRTPGEQLGEIFANIDSIGEALIEGSLSGAAVEDLVAQTHHAFEMFWRALALRNGADYVDAIFQRYEDSLKKEASHE